MQLYNKKNRVLNYECNYCRPHPPRTLGLTYSKYYVTIENDKLVEEEFCIPYNENIIHIENEYEKQTTSIGLLNKVNNSITTLFTIPLEKDFDIDSMANRVKKLMAFL